MSPSPLRGPHQVQELARRRLAKHWHTLITQEGPWPYSIPLGNPSSPDAAASFAETYRAARDLAAAAHTWGATLQHARRRIGGTSQELPTHLTVPTIDVFATIAGPPWPATLDAARRHLAQLDLDPTDSTTAKILRAVDGWDDTDVILLRRVATYFRTHGPATGLTARQIPLDGVHAKWVGQHKTAVKLLSGLDDLRLTERPSTVNFTYLDPDHRAAGLRWHDSYTLGDAHHLAYPPDLVIICENDDTALYYPPTPHAISLRGAGHAATRLAQIPWIADVPHLLYWGDIDHHGYEILDNLRHALGRSIPSLLMDTDTYEQHKRYGTTTDKRGRPINPKPSQQVQHLTPAENAVYQILTAPRYVGPLRIEQERIAYPTTEQLCQALESTC